MESITNNMELVIYCIPAGDFFTPLNDADMAIEKWWHGKSREDVILLREKNVLNDSQKKWKLGGLDSGWFQVFLPWPSALSKTSRNGSLMVIPSYVYIM